MSGPASPSSRADDSNQCSGSFLRYTTSSTSAGSEANFHFAFWPLSSGIDPSSTTLLSS